MKDEKCESNEAESKNLTSSESSHEAGVGINAAVVGSSGVGVNGNSHSNVTGKNGGS